MANQTNRLQLQLPLGTDQVPELRLAITNIANTLDTAVTVTQGALSAIPAAGFAGRRYYATDKGIELWDTGTGWVPTGPGLPIGAMAIWSLSTDPVDADGVTRWMVADGRQVAKASYAALNTLYNAAGYPYGQSGGNLILPDTRSRVMVGMDSGPSTGAAGRIVTGAHGLAGSGGAERVALATAELAVHNHGAATGTDSPDHAHYTSGTTSADNASGAYIVPYNTSAGQSWGGALAAAGNVGVANMLGGGWCAGTYLNHAHTWGAESGGASARHAHGIGNDGSGSSHQNLQPYLVVNHIIRVL